MLLKMSSPEFVPRVVYLRQIEAVGCLAVVISTRGL